MPEMWGGGETGACNKEVLAENPRPGKEMSISFNSKRQKENFGLTYMHSWCQACCYTQDFFK